MQGFSLIEVLVAVVVLSFGVLGVVGLQAAALQSNKEARYQSAGVRLARELADAIRGNNAVAGQTSMAANPYLFPATAVIGGPTHWPAAALDCSQLQCANPLDMASFEMRDWVSRVDTELPGAMVVVCFDDAPYDAQGIPVWGCQPGPGNPTLMIKIGWTRQSTNTGATGAAALNLAPSAPAVVLPVVPN